MSKYVTKDDLDQLADDMKDEVDCVICSHQTRLVPTVHVLTDDARDDRTDKRVLLFVPDYTNDHTKAMSMHGIGLTVHAMGRCPLAVGVATEGWIINADPRVAELFPKVRPSEHPLREERVIVEVVGLFLKEGCCTEMAPLVRDINKIIQPLQWEPRVYDSDHSSRVLIAQVFLGWHDAVKEPSQ